MINTKVENVKDLEAPGSPSKGDKFYARVKTMGRTTETCIALGLLVVSFLVLLLPQHFSKMPETSITISSTVYKIPSEASSYPVYLDGTWCSANEINAANGECAIAKANGIKAYMQVPTWAVIVFGPLLTGIVLIIINIKLYGFNLGPYNDSVNTNDSSKRSHSMLDLQGRLRPIRDVILGLILSVALANLITNVLKTVVGRPRPNAFALLALSDDYKIDVWRSFPSGHASGSMCGMYFLSLWLNCIVKYSFLWNKPGSDDDNSSSNGDGNGSSIGDGSSNSSSSISISNSDKMNKLYRDTIRIGISCLVFVPTMIALWVSVTRVQDYWHNYSDITAGVLIGVGCAQYGFYYCTRHITPKSDKSINVFNNNDSDDNNSNDGHNDKDMCNENENENETHNDDSDARRRGVALMV
jgi:membrane-associated phospholipid phosphatase